MKTQVVSKSQFETLEATMKANEARVAAARPGLSDTYIRAPFSGRVGLRRVSLGALISPGTVITTLDDTSSIKVDFARAGHVCRRTCAPDSRWSRAPWPIPAARSKARCVSVDSRIDPATRSVIVRALVPNQDAR